MARSSSTEVLKENPLEKSVKNFYNLGLHDAESVEGRKGILNSEGAKIYGLREDSLNSRYGSVQNTLLKANSIIGQNYIYSNFDKLSLDDKLSGDLVSKYLSNSPLAKNTDNPQIKAISKIYDSIKMLEEDPSQYINDFLKPQEGKFGYEIAQTAILSDLEGFVGLQREGLTKDVSSVLGIYGAQKLVGEIMNSYKISPDESEKAKAIIKKFKNTPSNEVTEELIKERDMANKTLDLAKNYGGIGSDIFSSYLNSYAQKVKEDEAKAAAEAAKR